MANLMDAKRLFLTGNPARDTTASFAAEWKSLDDGSKAEILASLGDGTLSY